MNTASNTTLRRNRTICMHVCQAQYYMMIQNATQFRIVVDMAITEYPELFPAEITFGYQMKEIRFSKKLKLKIRRIVIAGVNYTIRPSFVMPYMTGFVEDVEKPLFLRKFSVPFWALSHCFGRNPMYWYRLETSIGRHSLLGTTIKSPEKLPQHLCADEKHTRLLGEKTYIATTVGNGCILGANISESASEGDLQEAYSVFNEKNKIPDVISEKIKKLRKNLPQFSQAYDFPDSHRTSNMVDRLMQRMDRHLFSTQYFHGTLKSANLNIRAWALIQNFSPLNPWTVKQKGHVSSFQRVNGFQYHENWLQNLLISASLGGLGTGPPNPL